MKIILKLWITASFIFLIIVALMLFDAYVSFKYEVEEFQVSGQLNEAVANKEKLLNQIIAGLWSFAIYLIINIIVMIRWAFNN